MDIQLQKKCAAQKACEFIKDGMLIGIGTGSTVYYLIHFLSKLCKQGLKIQAVSSSVDSYAQAKKGGIPLADLDSITSIDLTIDGADEIDQKKRMIKGGGGALLREKILANASQKTIIIVDETKVVNTLGSCKLPVEILPFGHLMTLSKIEALGFQGEIRLQDDNSLYHTDNGNLIYDITLTNQKDTPEKNHADLIQIAGVLETGYFFNLADSMIIGKANGSFEMI